MKPQTLHFFPNAQAARDYRHEHGTGGWIFSNDEITVLFPPDMAPAAIFNHPATRGHSGKLIAN